MDGKIITLCLNGLEKEISRSKSWFENCICNYWYTLYAYRQTIYGKSKVQQNSFGYFYSKFTVFFKRNRLKKRV